MACKAALDKNLCFEIVVMDLSKAFDCLPLNIILSKLSAYDLSDEVALLSVRLETQIKLHNIVSS